LKAHGIKKRQFFRTLGGKGGRGENQTDGKGSLGGRTIQKTFQRTSEGKISDKGNREDDLWAGVSSYGKEVETTSEEGCSWRI